MALPGRFHENARLAALVLLPLLSYAALAAVFYFNNFHARKAVLVAFLFTLAAEALVRRRLPGPRRRLWYASLMAGLAGLAVALCAERVLLTWAGGAGFYFYPGGLMPQSDAGGYYRGALAMIEQGTLDDFCLRKPLGPCLLGLTLLLTGQNLQAALLVIAVLNGLSIAAAAVALSRTHGATAGLIMALALMGYVAEYLPSMLTEPTAFVGACLAFALLWPAFSGGGRKPLYAGVFLLGISLAIRPGAMLALPALALLAGWTHASAGALSKPGRPSRRFCWKTVALCAAIAAAPLVINFLAVVAINPEKTGKPDLALAVRFYGFAQGGQGTSALDLDHPEFAANGAAESRQAAVAFREGFAAAREKPFRFVMGVVKGYGTLFRHPDWWVNCLWPFVRPDVAVVLFLVALFAVAREARRKRREAWLLLAVLLSIVAGLPMYYDVGSRVIAATMPMLCAVTAAGIPLLLRIARTGPEAAAREKGRGAGPAVWISAALFALLTIGAPFFFIARRPGPEFSEKIFSLCAGCGPGERTIVFRASRGTFLHLLPDSLGGAVPNVRISSFKGWVEKPLRVLPPWCYVGTVHNLLEAQGASWLVLQEDPARYAGRLLSVCAQPAPGSKPRDRLFYGKIFAK